MKLRSYMREIRGRRSLRDLADAAGVNRGTLSLIELGRQLPKDDWVEGIERAYGAPLEQWYHQLVVRVLEPDEEQAA